MRAALQVAPLALLSVFQLLLPHHRTRLIRLLSRVTFVLQWDPLKRASAAQLLQMPFFKGEKKLPSPLPVPIEKSAFKAPKHTPASASASASATAALAHAARPTHIQLPAAAEPAASGSFAGCAADLSPPPQTVPPRAAAPPPRRPMMLSGDADTEPSWLKGSSSSGNSSSGIGLGYGNASDSSSSTSGFGDIGRGGGIAIAASFSAPAPATRFPSERTSPPPPASSSSDLHSAEAKPKFGRRAAQ